MDTRMREKINIIDKMADEDPLYQYMMQQYRLLEGEFDQTVSKLSYKRRDLIWDFVMKCEAMSQRKLQLACTLIPDETLKGP